jgi:hypothetical protein
MAINPLQHGDKVLLVRQRHEAKRMGLHWDYRFVLGDKAFSFATKKHMPEPGKSIVFFEQPVHDAAYALSQRIEIPDGNYGAGVTTMDWAKKATIESHEDGTMVIHTGDQRFLLKKLDGSKYGAKSWLFKNLSDSNMSNKYLEKIAKISIDPKNKGKLHKAMGKPEGEELSTSDEEAVKAKAKKSGNTKLEREAQFAINAKKWKK